MASLDLNQCSQECFSCIRAYKEKFSLEKGETFDIRCRGIMSDELQQRHLDMLPESERKEASLLLDPVKWAAENFDWHCLDPDNSVWMRKDPAEYERFLEEADGDGSLLLNKSRYHRPYQALMLRCTSNRKICRIGRQAGKTEVLVLNAAIAAIQQPYNTPGKDYKIVVIAPYQTQVEVFYERMLEVLSSFKGGSPILHARRNPNYTIVLKNDTYIKFFTAGVASGSNSDSIRGQSGSILVFDEADMLSEEDINSALAPVTNDPLAVIWMSSTPRGKRELFYKNCHNRRYREYHYSSADNPLWNDELEKDFRSQYTEVGYIHEVLANFGEQEAGVFQVKYVKRAGEDYFYEDMKPKASCIYTMGVDWNDAQHGVNIVVLEYNPKHNRFKIATRDILHKVENTQLEACERIAELNRIWKPMAIYADAGYGGVQVEVLHNFSGGAMQDPARGPGHPDSHMKDILKKFDFGSSLEVFDFWTKNKIKKDAKSFLVESTVRRFEGDDITISKHDDILERQLLNYVIDHVSVNGRVVYKSSNPKAVGDHLLDAFMLSVVAYILEATPLGKPLYSDHILFTGQPGVRKGYGDIPVDMIIHPDHRHKAREAQEERLPDMGRSDGVENTNPTIYQNTPGANMSNEKSMYASMEEFSADIVSTPRPATKQTQLLRMRRAAHQRRPGSLRKNI